MTARLCGAELTFEAVQAVRTLSSLSTIQPVLEEVLSYVLGAAPTAEASTRLGSATKLDATAVGALFTGLDWIIRTCVRSSLKSKALHAELTDCRVHPPFVEPILAAIERGRAQLAPSQLTDLDDAAALRARLDAPTLDDLRWRLDVIISSSSLQVVLRPQLTLQCTLSDGTIHAFHVTKQQLSELRFVAARCLKEMDDVETRLPAMP